MRQTARRGSLVDTNNEEVNLAKVDALIGEPSHGDIGGFATVVVLGRIIFHVSNTLA